MARGKNKPPHKDSMDAMVSRALNDAQIAERKNLLARKYAELRSLEKRKANQVKSINAEIKAVSDDLDRMSDEIVSGEEMVKQGELHFDDTAGAARVPQPVAAGALAKVAETAGDITPVSPEQVKAAEDAKKAGNGKGGNGHATGPRPVGPEGMAARTRTGRRRGSEKGV